jgi:hypothetical protein
VFSKADVLEAYSLDAPMAVDIARKLRGKGVVIPADIVYTDELVSYLCQYK